VLIEGLTCNDLGFTFAIDWSDVEEGDADVNRFSDSSDRFLTAGQSPYLTDAAATKSKAAYLT
jgi:hypothetical protein